MLLIGSGQGRRSPAALPVLAGAVAFVLAGCADGAVPSTGFQTDEELRSRVDAVASSLRVGAQDESDAAVDMEFVHARLLRACLRDEGFDIEESAQPADFATLLPEIGDLHLWLARGEPLGLGAAVSDAKRLQQMRAAVAAVEGHEEKPYPPGAEDVVYGNPRVEITVPLPGDHGGSVTIPVGGCFGAATQELYGVPAETFERTRLALPRLDDVVAETIAESSVSDLLDSYSSCMRDHGLDAETPAELADVVGPPIQAVLDGSGQPADVVAAESKAVAADADCKSRSGVGTAFATEFVSHGTAALKRSEGSTVEYRRMMDHARSVANDLGPPA